MEINRRDFLALSTAVGLSPSFALAQRSDLGGARYLAARKRDGHDEAVVLNDQGQDQLCIPMPARGHSFAIDAPRARAVVFGRQPGFSPWRFP